MVPKGYPGMAEVGNMRLPQKVLKKGIRDMIRVSDARMSGTAFGTVILHTSPEAAVKGPLAAVQSGDMIEVDVYEGIMNLLVDQKIIDERLKNYNPILPEIKGVIKKCMSIMLCKLIKVLILIFLLVKEEQK